jgi:aldehyde dehydrogenase (NAD(P)+)
LVSNAVYDRFVEAFAAQVQKISVVGDPFLPATFQGPQITKQQLESVRGYIKTGIAEGATLVTGGERMESGNNTTGFFVPPTVFKDVTNEMKIWQEEIFGPVVAISRFCTEEEAIQCANKSMYGLGSAVFTKDISRALRVARKLEAGMVWINSSNDVDHRVPFGGVKQSGIGRELGEAGLKAYTVEKAVHVNVGTSI